MAKSIPLSANRSRPGRGPRRKSNGWTAKWSDELKIDKDETATIQLTRAKYHDGEVDMPYYAAPLFQVQYQNNFGNTSWGYFRGQDSSECTLQKLADSNHPAVKEPKYGEPNRFFLNAIHYSLFQRTPVVKNGKPLTYSEGKLKGQPVYSWIEIKSTREKKNILSQPGAAESEDIAFFRKKFLHLSVTQFKVVQEITRKARTMCKCGGTLFPSVFICRSCEEVLLDTNNAKMTDAEIANYGDQDIRCRHCGTVDFPNAVYDCDSCQDPRSHEYYEVVAKLKKVTGSNGYPTIMLDSVIPASEFQTEFKTPIVTGTTNNEFVYDDALTDVMKVQYDFDQYTEAKSNAEYSEMLGLRDGDIGFASNTKRYDKFR